MCMAVEPHLQTPRPRWATRSHWRPPASAPSAPLPRPCCRHLQQGPAPSHPSPPAAAWLAACQLSAGVPRATNSARITNYSDVLTALGKPVWTGSVEFSQTLCDIKSSDEN